MNIHTWQLLNHGIFSHHHIWRHIGAHPDDRVALEVWWHSYGCQGWPMIACRGHPDDPILVDHFMCQFSQMSEGVQNKKNTKYLCEACQNFTH